jgi:hypothetical protein
MDQKAIHVNTDLPNQMFENVVTAIAVEKATFQDRTRKILAVSDAASELEKLLPESNYARTEKVGERIIREFNEAGGFDSTSVPPAEGGDFWYVVEEIDEELDHVYKFGITSQSMEDLFSELKTDKMRGVIVWQLPKDSARNGAQGPFDNLLNAIAQFANVTATSGTDQYHLATIDRLWQLVAAIDGSILAWGGSRFTKQDASE